MLYFTVKNDFAFMKEYRTLVMRLWEYEATAGKGITHFDSYIYAQAKKEIQAEANNIKGYQEVRALLAKYEKRAVNIAGKMGVKIYLLFRLGMTNEQLRAILINLFPRF